MISAPEQPIELQSSHVARRQRKAKGFGIFFLLITSLAVLVLGVLLWTVIERGWSYMSWHLITSMPSRKPEIAGLNSALVGTLLVISLTAAVAFPIGVGAAIYLEEYAPRNWMTKILQVNIANLAGVPSIVYGMLGLAIFVELLQFGRTALAGSLTMALLILPVIIISSQEAIRAVPLSLRQASFALGATQWQTVRSHVLPAAMPGILTGTILALSRAVGETAPLLVAGASAYLTFRPSGWLDNYTALPIQIYNWTSRPQDEFRALAAAGIIVLLLLLLAMNATAIYLRQRFSDKARW